MESVTRVQILDDSVCISLHANAFADGMKPFVQLKLELNDRANVPL